MFTYSNIKICQSLACQKTVSPLLTLHMTHCSPCSEGSVCLFMQDVLYFLYLQNNTDDVLSTVYCCVLFLVCMSLVCKSFPSYFSCNKAAVCQFTRFKVKITTTVCFVQLKSNKLVKHPHPVLCAKANATYFSRQH